MMLGDDILRLHYFFMGFVKQAFARGAIPWWNPYTFSGVPLIGNTTVALWYPLYSLFYLFPAPTNYLLVYFSDIIILFSGSLWVCRRILIPRISLIGAIAASVIISYSGVMLSRIWAGHVEIVSAIALVPWVFGTAVNLLTTSKRRTFIWFAVFLALQFFAGYQTIALMTLEFVGIFALMYCLSKKTVVPMLRLIGGGIIALGLSAVQLVPNIEFFYQSIRTYPFPYWFAASGAMTWESLLQLFSPFYFGTPAEYHGPPPNYHEQGVFISVIGIGLVVGGLWVTLIEFVRFLKKKTLPVSYVFPLTFAAVIFVSLWISLGPNAPFDLFHVLWQTIPMYHSIRIPPRHLFLFTVSAGFLAGIVIDRFFKKPWMRVMLTAGIIIELAIFSRAFVISRPLPETKYDKELVELFDPKGGLFRILPNFGNWVPPRDVYDFNAPMMYKSFSVTGYDPSVLRSYFEFIDATNRATVSSIPLVNIQIPYLASYSRAFSFLNIKYVIVPTYLDQFGGVSSPQFRLIKENPAQWYRIYEQTSFLPRYFLVPRAIFMPSKSTVLDRLRKNDLDLGSTVLLVGNDHAEQVNTCPVQEGEVHVVFYTPNRVTLSVDSPCAAYVVSSEVMYPGWEARLDGTPAEILTGNNAFRVVRVPEGKHEIIYTFVPKTFYYGLGISLVSFFICFVVLIRKK